jgi:hypothetical protein
MATSSRRTQANRQNALKSTGPKTRAGKAASSGNAVQHGILSRHLILPSESRDEFDALLQQLMTEQQPVGTLEQALVERMAVALWRQRRLVAAETAQVQLQQADLSGPEIVRITQITGIREVEWLNIVARQPMAELVDLEAVFAACYAWIVQEPMRDVKALAVLKVRVPIVWGHLADALGVDTPQQAADKIASDGAKALHEWEKAVRFQATRLHKVVPVLQQMRQSALQLRESDVLSRYQSSLDNDLYKAMRALREAQHHRLEQAALNARTVERVGSGA